MGYLRINIQGRLTKPIAPAIQTKLTAAQAVIADVKTYCQKINLGQPNEEYSIRTDYDNLPGWIDFDIDLSIPEDLAGTLVLSSLDPEGNQVGGIKIASVVVPKLADLRTKIRDFKQYLTKTDNGELMAEVFICKHDDQTRLIPDGARIEV